jgi:hypothetical protein
MYLFKPCALVTGETLLANILVDFEVCESVGSIPPGTLGKEPIQISCFILFKFFAFLCSFSGH